MSINSATYKMAEDSEKTCGEDRVEQGRLRKLTEKGVEERLQRFIALRRRTLGTLTSQMKEIEAMMSDAQNVTSVKDMMEGDFVQSLSEFDRLHTEVGNLLSEEEKMHDHDNWFEPKMAQIKDFMKTVKRWAADAHDSVGKETSPLEKDNVIEEEEAVLPSDSVSQIGVSNGAKARSGVSHVSSSAGSRASSTLARQEAEHAALLERAAALKKKQRLEFEAVRIKAEKEELVLETALAESQAKLRVLKEYERSEDGRSSYVSMQKSQSGDIKKERASMTLLQPAKVNVHEPRQVQRSRMPQQPPQVFNQGPRAQTGDDILTVMQRQNVITELLVKQQQLSQLPTRDISVFKGDALQYKSFMRAFEHAIEQKTDNDQDKLYFLEQFTDGEPQELVRSCAHMTPSKGYREAK